MSPCTNTWWYLIAGGGGGGGGGRGAFAFPITLSQFCLYTWNSVETIEPKKCHHVPTKDSTVRAPVFDMHHYIRHLRALRKAHGSLLSGWMNYNYTACCWFPTSINILILPSQSNKSALKVTDCTVQSAEYWCFYGTWCTNKLLVKIALLQCENKNIYENEIVEHCLLEIIRYVSQYEVILKGKVGFHMAQMHAFTELFKTLLCLWSKEMRWLV